MYQEKKDIPDGQGKMYDPCHFIPAKNETKPFKLYRLVNGEPRQYRADHHDNNCRVSDTLRGIVFSLWRAGFTDTEITKYHLPGFPERAPVGQQVFPFTRENGIEYIGNPIQEEQP